VSSKFLRVYLNDLVVIGSGHTATIPVAGEEIYKIIRANNNVS
jgi:hypothetical protein